MNPKDTNPQRINNELREQAEGYNWSGINFPTSWKDIDKFESQNETISVNDFGYEAEIYPLRISINTYKPGRGELVNLLLISNEEKQHNCVINYNYNYNYNCRCDTLLVVLRRVCVLWILAVRFLATATAHKLRMLYYIFVGNGTCVVGCPIGL